MYEISILNKQGLINTKIATTIGRELKRNADDYNQDYRSKLAQKKTYCRHREKKKHVIFSSQMDKKVTEKLKNEYSAEQIKGYYQQGNRF